MLGYASTELLGQSARMLYESDQEFDLVGDKKYRDMARDKIGVLETRWKLKDGKVVDVLLSSTSLDPGDPSRGVTFTALDISARKAAEEKQREMARMKSEFIATASHELRTPLAVAMGYLELLQSNRDFGPQEQQEFLSCIMEKVQVLERLIDELLDISRIESGRILSLERTPVRIAEAVAAVVRQFPKEGSRHQFFLWFCDEKIELVIDKWKFAQVVENLVDNAVKFSPRGGNITIRGEVVDECYQLSVRDEGIGMNAEQQKNVFEKFYRADNSNTAARGLGIGLFLAKNIIEAHRGTIWVESRPGEGTHFFFRLPLEFNSLDDRA
jgi:PAS domain S-box-containing protein